MKTAFEIMLLVIGLGILLYIILGVAVRVYYKRKNRLIYIKRLYPKEIPSVWDDILDELL